MTDMLSSLTISQGLRKLQNRSQSTVRNDIQFSAADNQSSCLFIFTDCLHGFLPFLVAKAVCVEDEGTNGYSYSTAFIDRSTWQ